jgi:hypothetical protein
VGLRLYLRRLPLCAQERGHAMGFARRCQRLKHSHITRLQ